MQLCYVKKDLDCLAKCVLILLMSTENKVKFNNKKKNSQKVPIHVILAVLGNNYLSMCTMRKVKQEDWKKMYPEVTIYPHGMASLCVILLYF